MTEKSEEIERNSRREEKRREDFMRLDEIESSVELKLTSSMIFFLFEFYLLNC